MDKPLVSVIIACYNAENYIDQCFEALVGQTYQNIEIVVCDDASKDNSLIKLNEWAQRDTRIKVLHNEKNLFAAATRNYCFKEAKGDFFCIQDIDDVSMPNRIERLIEELQKEITPSLFDSWEMQPFELKDVEDVEQYFIPDAVFDEMEQYYGSRSEMLFAVNKEDNPIFHIRPHATLGFSRLSDGSEYGSGSISNSDELPDGQLMTKQSYWLHKNYILSQLNDDLKNG